MKVILIDENGERMGEHPIEELGHSEGLDVTLIKDIYPKCRCVKLVNLNSIVFEIAI
jgi:hypothetical protein